MCWDALLEEHRLQKHQTLQRRVGIQRDLITKNDQLFTELRKKDEEERLGVYKSDKTTCDIVVYKKSVYNFDFNINLIVVVEPRPVYIYSMGPIL